MPSLSEIKQTAILWKLAITKGILYSFVMLGSCWLTALNKLDWSMLSYDDRRNIIIGIFVSWGTGMIMFLDKSASAIASGHIPGIENGDFPDDSKPITPPPADPVAQPTAPKTTP